MADPKDLDNESLKQKIELQKESGNAVEQTGNKIKQASAEAEEFNLNLDRASTALNKLGINGEAISSLKDRFKPTIDTINVLGNSIQNVVKQLNIGDWGNIIAAGAGINKIIGPLAETKDMVQKSLDVGLGALSGPVKEAEDSIKQLITTQLTARTAFLQSGQTIENSKEIIKGYPQMLRDMSVETGISTKEMDEAAKVAGTVLPNSLKTVTKESIELSGGLTDSVSKLAVATTAFRAFGITGSAAGEAIKKSYLDFNQTELETAKNLGIMSIALKDTGVDYQTARDQIMSASQPLAIFGRQATESTNVWRTFTDTLRAGGVPISQIGDIVKNVTGSIANLSVENRAFIGMMSGVTRGSSALGGALKMELMMRQEGGMQKNLEAMTSAVSKLTGGQIITLQQAANNPQLEMQFQLQRQTLQKLGMQGTSDQLARVLEVMQKVQQGGMSEIESGKAMSEIYKEGRNLQQDSLTSLENIALINRAQLAVATKQDNSLELVNQALKGPKVKNEGLDLTMLENLVKTTVAVSPQKVAKRQRQQRATEYLMNPETRKKVELPTAASIKASVPSAMTLPQKSVLRAKESSIPSMINVINNGNSQVHQDLQQLLETTKAGLAPLRESKLQAMPSIENKAEPSKFSGSESTLLIKIESSAKNTVEEVKKFLEEKFSKSLLGIQ